MTTIDAHGNAHAGDGKFTGHVQQPADPTGFPIDRADMKPADALRECLDLWGSGAWDDGNAQYDLAEVMGHVGRLLETNIYDTYRANAEAIIAMERKAIDDDLAEQHPNVAEVVYSFENNPNGDDPGYYVLCLEKITKIDGSELDRIQVSEEWDEVWETITDAAASNITREELASTGVQGEDGGAVLTEDGCRFAYTYTRPTDS